MSSGVACTNFGARQAPSPPASVDDISASLWPATAAFASIWRRARSVQDRPRRRFRLCNLVHRTDKPATPVPGAGLLADAGGDFDHLPVSLLVIDPSANIPVE